MGAERERNGAGKDKPGQKISQRAERYQEEKVGPLTQSPKPRALETIGGLNETEAEKSHVTLPESYHFRGEAGKQKKERDACGANLQSTC